MRSAIWLLAWLTATATAADPAAEWRRIYNDGLALHRRGDFTASAAMLEKALTLSKGFGPRGWREVVSLNSLGGVYEELGRYGDAERVRLDCLVRLERTRGRNHAEYAVALHQVAVLRSLLGDFKGAEPLQRKAVAILQGGSEDDRLALALARAGLGDTLTKLKRYPEARQVMEEARAALEVLVGPEHERTAAVLNSLGVLALLQKRPGEAIALFRQSLAALEKKSGRDHPHLVPGLTNLARSLARLGDVAEADATFRRALSIAELRLGREHPAYADAAGKYAQLLRRSGRKAEARTYERESREGFAASMVKSRNGFTVDARSGLR